MSRYPPSNPPLNNSIPFPPLPPPPGMPQNLPPSFNTQTSSRSNQPVSPDFVPLSSHHSPGPITEVYGGPPPRGSWHPTPPSSRGFTPLPFHHSNRHSPRRRGHNQYQYRGASGRGTSPYHQYGGRHSDKWKPDYKHESRGDNCPSKRSNESTTEAPGKRHCHDKVFWRISENPWAGLLTEEEDRQHKDKLAKKFAPTESSCESSSREREEETIKKTLSPEPQIESTQECIKGLLPTTNVDPSATNNTTTTALCEEKGEEEVKQLDKDNSDTCIS